jgi:hypothetical protein
MMLAFKRRWLRFSLGTLFVATTLVGCWLGWHVRWIRQRHQALETIDARPKVFSVVGGVGPNGGLPWSLWLLGERPREFIELKLESQEDLDRAVSETQRLFPEAWIQPYYVPPGARVPTDPQFAPQLHIR